MFQFLSVTRAGNRTPFVLLCASMLAFAPAATVAQDRNAPLTIEADDLLEWNQTDGVYTAKGNAVAVQGDAEIRGNLLVATYDPKAEGADIETITATGRVCVEVD